MILFDKKKLLLNSPNSNVAKYVVSGIGAKAMYSYDGVEWAETPLPAEVTGTSVCYGKNMFIITCVEKQIFYSKDGKTWASATLPKISGSASYISSCYGNGVFVAITSSGPQSLYSTDGIEWNITNLPDSFYWRGICYADDRFVAIGNSTSVATAAYSYDGITWQMSNANISGLTTGSLPICYGNGVFVAKNSGNGKPFYSTDLSSWTQSSTYVNSSFLCYGNNVFIGARGGSSSYYSYDGVVWNKGEKPSYGYGIYPGICCYDGERFWLIDDDGPIVFSYDGVNWEDGAVLPSEFQAKAIGCYKEE